MSGRLPRPSSPAPPSLCPCCRSRKMWKYPRYCFSSNGILISTVPHPQSSVVAFIPSPSLSACCLLNLSSQGDHLDFSRFFLHCVSSKPYYIWHLSCPYIQKIDFAISLPFDLSWVSHCPTLILLCQGKCFIHKELFQTKHYLHAAIKILFFILFWTFVVSLVLTFPTCLGPIPLCHLNGFIFKELLPTKRFRRSWQELQYLKGQTQC